MTKIKLWAAGILIALASYLIGGSTVPAKLGMTSRSQASCSVSSVTPATVGNQLSSTILAANTRRAWAIIQSPSGATNTAALSFDEGAAATLNSGLALNATTADATYPVMQEITFGVNTDFPYNGVVTGISNYGSSTLKITECLF